MGQSGAVGLHRQKERLPSSFIPANDNIFSTISCTCSVNCNESHSPINICPCGDVDDDVFDGPYMDSFNRTFSAFNTATCARNVSNSSFFFIRVLRANTLLRSLRRSLEAVGFNPLTRGSLAGEME